MNLTFESEYSNDAVFWYVCFWIGKNKRGYEALTQTGKDGVKSLLWAKQCIKDFMKLKSGSVKPQHLCITWDNGRRRDTYFRGLSDLGFVFKYLYGEKYLYKLKLLKKLK